MIHVLTAVAQGIPRPPQLDASFKEWEAKLATYHQTHLRAEAIKAASDAQLRLMCGELTAQEIRSIRAVVNHILP